MWFLSGLPIVGKIFDWLNKKQDTDLEKYKVRGQIDVEALKQDTEIIKARAGLAAVMKDDPATKIGRWFFIAPTGFFYAATIWDSTKVLRNMFEWGVLELPEWMQYMPYAVVAYLFAVAIKNAIVGVK